MRHSKRKRGEERIRSQKYGMKIQREKAREEEKGEISKSICEKKTAKYMPK